ncbi:hypothetical protein [Paenarthrobacter nitroguajacolicus]|uniref:hypothetical protein n=1 Tax=Paenarthrobacter nitroguajacolicus TaxID=211146 RepID=UPI00248B6A86|nr:hypothetical protein [Paenarthrobacter nitroguajacolicus]MDI2035934.1 hypothetical protein [Paenarthrobacter nitroguajacolicus]
MVSKDMWDPQVGQAGVGALELYRLLLDVQDGLGYLMVDDLLTLARDVEQLHGTARNAVGVVVHHLDAAGQVLAVLETQDPR